MSDAMFHWSILPLVNFPPAHPSFIVLVNIQMNWNDSKLSINILLVQVCFSNSSYREPNQLTSKQHYENGNLFDMWHTIRLSDTIFLLNTNETIPQRKAKHKRYKFIMSYIWCVVYILFIYRNYKFIVV